MKNQNENETIAEVWGQLQIAVRALSEAAVEATDFELQCDIATALRAAIKASRRAGHLIAEATLKEGAK